MSDKDITELGVMQVQNGISSIDEVRARLHLPPWGLAETSEPVVFTAQGPIPFSKAPELIRAAQEKADQLRKIENLEKLVRLLLDPQSPWGEILNLRKQLGL